MSELTGAGPSAGWESDREDLRARVRERDVAERFGLVHQRLDAIDELTQLKLDLLRDDQRTLTARLDRLDAKVDRLGGKPDRLDGKLDGLLGESESRVEARFAETGGKLDEVLALLRDRA
ncbi:hypothetical protein [Bailinhaonella thermotolerans]|nr:hypothetical protein [Bailinhaonella thermotolerans]